MASVSVPSMGIYSYELFNFYDVENIIRIGSAGAMHEKLPVRSLVMGMSASYNSTFADQYKLPGTYAPTASYDLLRMAVDKAEEMGLDYRVGNILSSDTFYSDAKDGLEWQKMGVLAAEMEAAALYMNAARAGKNALAILTISDNIVTGEACTAEERQNTFTQMMKLALEIA